MITYLPFASLQASAAVLDTNRLGRMPSAVLDIFKGIKSGSNHPAVKMWRDWPGPLFQFYLNSLDELRRRGYRDPKCNREIEKYYANSISKAVKPKRHFADVLHLSHRVQLWKKDPVHYAKFASDGQEFGWMKLQWPGEVE